MNRRLSEFPGIELECTCGKKRIVPDTFTKAELKETAILQIKHWISKLKFTKVKQAKGGNILWENIDPSKVFKQWERDQERTLIVKIMTWIEFNEINLKELF